MSKGFDIPRLLPQGVCLEDTHFPPLTSMSLPQIYLINSHTLVCGGVQVVGVDSRVAEEHTSIDGPRLTHGVSYHRLRSMSKRGCSS